MKVGFTCSCFDLFHAGHLMMLKEAKTQCDYLIIGLQTDPTIDKPCSSTSSEVVDAPEESSLPRLRRAAAAGEGNCCVVGVGGVRIRDPVGGATALSAACSLA